MSYEIYDHWACIKFVKDGVEFFLAKSTVKKIAVVGIDTIKISTGNCLGGVSFHYRDVVSPVTVTIVELVDYINGWITQNLLPPDTGA
jgi:hypothetical protein